MASPRGFRADRGALSYGRIEQLAAKIRKRLDPKASPRARARGIAVFEELHGHTVLVEGTRVALDCAVKELPSGVEGETRFDGRKIVVTLSEETYRALEEEYCRARHTLYHEISHAFLHTSQIVRMATIPHTTFALQRSSGGRSHRFCDDTEWQADACAAALLMPARGLRALERRHPLSSSVLQTTFGTSAESAQIRLRVFRKYREDL